MLQKIIFESLNNKSSLSTSSSQKYSFQNSSIFTRQILYTKYSKFEYSYSLFCTNNLIFNEKCRIVARFKDYLVLDDSTEFLRRFYSKKELRSRLKKIFNFYESYCKIFPNYMILPESQFLYRNIRKKQKMIDAFNEIKKEEEENRKHLKIGLSDDKRKNANVVFTKKIQESIERYHPSLSNILSNTFMSDINNEFENDNNKSIVTISLSSQKPINFNEINKEINPFDNKYFTPNMGSFTEKNFNDNINNSQNSIFKIVQILNNNNNFNENLPFSNNEENTQINNINPKEKTNKNKNIINNNSKKNNKINLNKNITKKNNNINNTNNNTNTNNNKNINTIIAINKHTRVKTNLNNSNNKKKKPEINVTTRKKFISHKSNISVPLASNMLNSNDNNINNINNLNNIIEGDNTIKIINNINNIIINEDKNKTINNGMIININNNYFQVKDSKVKNNIIKRVKSKEEQIKEKSKDNKKLKEKNKETELNKFKYFREKRTYTSYNTQNTTKKSKKFLINDIQSPNSKKDKYPTQKTETKKKEKNSKKYILTINDIKSSKNNDINNTNIYRNINYQNDKKPNHKLIGSKTLVTNPNEEINKPKNKNHKNSNNNHIAMTETNVTISASYNHSKIDNKLISNNKTIKEIPKIDSVDKKKLTINRKIVNNYFTATQKKKTYQGRFHIKENSVSTNINNLNNNPNDKMDFINICNIIENSNNPIKFKLNKKMLLKKKAKTNSLQINDKNEFLSSFNLPKDKMQKANLDLDIINIDEKMVKYQKKSLKKLVNYKTQTNSEAELIKDINKNEHYLNTIESKSIKKEKIIKKNKQNNINNKTNIEKPESTKEVKKLNVKEMKEKYHKLLRGNKLNHGSYDIANRLHLFKKFKGLNNIVGNMTNSVNINSTISAIKNKRNPLLKKNVLSPNERIQNTLNDFIKTPNKNRFEKKKESATIEVTNLENKFKSIGKENKHMDSNNKKMKFIKK